MVLKPKTTLNNIKIRQEINQNQANAFIITNDCNSNRFKSTKDNIERVFPNFFHIYCFKSIPLNDSRIHTSSSSVYKKFSSNLLSFIFVWTYEIPKYSQYNNDNEWSFVFEDDVNFIRPSKVSLSNYIEALQKLMTNTEIHFQHGLFYLGICGPTFENNSQTLIIKYSNDKILSSKGYGWCAHAMGLTIKRAKYFWTEISSYRPTPDAAIDAFIRDYCIRSGNQYYILGSNLHWPPQTGHYGIAFQDRRKFPSQMT
jgi:hypothetical protein